jgi:hypothetical protein
MTGRDGRTQATGGWVQFGRSGRPIPRWIEHSEPARAADPSVVRPCLASRNARPQRGGSAPGQQERPIQAWIDHPKATEVSTADVERAFRAGRGVRSRCGEAVLRRSGSRIKAEPACHGGVSTMATLFRTLLWDAPLGWARCYEPSTTFMLERVTPQCRQGRICPPCLASAMRGTRSRRASASRALVPGRIAAMSPS